MNWNYSVFFFPFFFFFSWQIEARDLVVISYENFKEPLSGESLKELEQLKENFSIELGIPLFWIVLRA